MHIVMCLGWKAPRSPPKVDEQEFDVKTRLCYAEEWSWQLCLGLFQQSLHDPARDQNIPSLHIPLLT